MSAVLAFHCTHIGFVDVDSPHDVWIIKTNQHCESVQPAPNSSDHPSSAQSNSKVSATKVISQWELCVWIAEQELARCFTNMFFAGRGTAEQSFQSTTEFQELDGFDDARRGDSSARQLNSVESCLVVRSLTDIPTVLTPTLGTPLLRTREENSGPTSQDNRLSP